MKWRAPVALRCTLLIAGAAWPCACDKFDLFVHRDEQLLLCWPDCGTQPDGGAPAQSCEGKKAGIACRPSAGGCDPEERCDGTSALCPPDEVLPATSECGARGVYCDGQSAVCPGGPYPPMHEAGNVYISVWGASADDVWLGGISGNFLHWDGVLWRTVPSGTSQVLHGIWGWASNDVWAVGHSIVHWNGAEWSQVSIPALGELAVLSGVWGSSATSVWAVGTEKWCDGPAYVLYWNGDTWNTAYKGAKQCLRAVWGSGPNDVWAGGEYGSGYTNNIEGNVLLHWNGVNWTETSLGRPWGRAISDIWGSSATNVWAASSTTWHWNGTEWSSVSNLGGEHVWGSSESNVWRASSSGGLFHWDGRTWSDAVFVESGSGDSCWGRACTSLGAIWGSGPSDVYVIGSGGQYGRLGNHPVIEHFDGLTWSNLSLAWGK